MTATTSSTALANVQPAFTGAERLALAWFWGSRGLTRDAYTLDLRCVTRRAGIGKHVSPHTLCGTHSSPPPATPGFGCAMCPRPPPTPTHAPRCAMTGHAPASTGTPPTSSPPSVLELRDGTPALIVLAWPPILRPGQDDCPNPAFHRA
jgi:hypothetical protein